MAKKVTKDTKKPQIKLVKKKVVAINAAADKTQSFNENNIIKILEQIHMALELMNEKISNLIKVIQEDKKDGGEEGKKQKFIIPKEGFTREEWNKEAENYRACGKEESPTKKKKRRSFVRESGCRD